jgi:hypothetical protein
LQRWLRRRLSEQPREPLDGSPKKHGDSTSARAALEIALRLGRIRRAYPFRLMAARCDDTTAITIAAITLQIALVRIGVR